MDTEGDPFQLVSLHFPWNVVLVFALILVSAFFAMAEIALVSVRKTRIRQLVEEKVPHARTVQRLIENPTRILATAQIGITLVAFFASAAGAVTMAEPIAKILHRIPLSFVSENASSIAVILITLILGFFTLVIGEISPKSLALQQAERIALWVAGPLTLLAALASPFVKLITWSSNLLIRPFGGTASFAPPILSEEELKMLVEAGEEDGVIEEEEREMIHSIFEFTDTVVRKVMTPRTDIKAVEMNESVTEMLEVIMDQGHSRVPVYEETVDNIVGIVHAKDLLKAIHENGKAVAIKELMRPPYVIPENKKVDELLAEFKKRKTQMAIVVDEYGGTAGLVTVEDLIEEIVGDIMDEYDMEEPMLVTIDANTVIVDSRMPIDEVNEQMEISLPDEEFDTIGGFVFGVLGREALQGEQIEYDGVTLVVEKTDGRRIEKIKIVRSEPTLLELSEDEVDE